jgi:hypothetical protein
VKTLDINLFKEERFEGEVFITINLNEYFANALKEVLENCIFINNFNQYTVKTAIIEVIEKRLAENEQGEQVKSS